MTRWAGAVLGGVTFLGAHALEAWTWRSWFAPGADYAAWFLNSGRAVGLTVACLFIVSTITAVFGSVDRRESLVHGACFSGGAFATMAVVLFVIGPGTIWPIALFVGAGIIAASGVSGSLVGHAGRHAFLR
jgi:hypothetical protein